MLAFTSPVCNAPTGCSACRPFEEVDLEPLVALDLPHLEHLELRAQNEEGFGSRNLEPLAQAKMPSLKYGP
jgi:hypothetical protein